MNRPNRMQAFLRAWQLPNSYLVLAERWFEPLAADIARYRVEAGRPLLVGVNGAQGSGKSTLAALMRLLLESVHGLRAIDLSIDDFYLTHAQRQTLAGQVHPLLATRGVPGTHDVPLMTRTLEDLSAADVEVSVPRFDKARDDRVPAAQWERVAAPLDVVVLEGWCLGVPPQTPEALTQAVNALEEREDPHAVWRRFVNDAIARDYLPLYDRVDVWIMLQAPSFQCVYQWRAEQEEKLAQRQDPASRNRVMGPEALARFIQHYHRLTEHGLRTLPARIHYLYCLDAERRIDEAARPRSLRFA